MSEAKIVKPAEHRLIHRMFGQDKMPYHHLSERQRDVVYKLVDKGVLEYGGGHVKLVDEYRYLLDEKPMTTKEEKAANAGVRATCQGCLRDIRLVDGRMVRHGWSFQSTSGRYGWHTGACRGTRHPQLEVACDVALGCVQIINGAIDGRLHDLAKLLARPAELSVSESYYDHEVRRRLEREVKVSRNDIDAASEYVSSNRYESVLRKRVAEVRRWLKSLAADSLAFDEAITKHHDTKDVHTQLAEARTRREKAARLSAVIGFPWTG